MRGGIQNQYVGIMNGLLEYGFNVTLFVFEEKGELLRRLSPGIEVIASGSRHLKKPLNFFSAIVATYELIKVIKRKKPDILYCRIPRPKLPILLAGKIMRKRVVLAEGNSPYDFKHKRYPWFKRFIQKFCYGNADKVLAVSKQLALEMQSFYGLKEVFCIYNGIDIDYIRKKAEENLEHPWFGKNLPVICSVAALIERKNIHDILQAAEIARKKVDFRLIIVGEGVLRERLERLSRDLSVDDIVEFVGYQPNPYAYMERSDLFILSSRSEGLPNVVLESMSLGVPTISTDCNYGPREIIEDEKNGILVPVGDPNAIADAIVRLLGSDKFRSSISKNAMATSQEFTLEKMVFGYNEFFKKLIS